MFNRRKLVKYKDNLIKKYHLLKPLNVSYVNIREDQLFFITGYDKSGTTWMKKAINAVDGFSCLGSNQFFDLMPSKNGMSTFTRHLINMNNENNPFNLNKNTFYDLFRNNYLNKICKLSPKNNMYYGEKSTAQDVNSIQYFFPGSKQIVLVRDMRDIIVSFAFHFERRYKYKEKKWSPQRSKFDEKGFIKEDFIKREVGKIKTYYEHLNMHKKNDNVLFIKYEDLNSNQGKHYFINIISHICNKDTDKFKASITKSWKNHTFEKLTKGRKKGEVDTKSFFRSGKSGDFIRYLKEEQIMFINKELNDYLKQYQYI